MTVDVRISFVPHITLLRPEPNIIPVRHKSICDEVQDELQKDDREVEERSTPVTELGAAETVQRWSWRVKETC